MINIICIFSKYIIIFLMSIYTFTCFSVFAYKDERQQRNMLRVQSIIMFLMHGMTFATLFLQSREIKYLQLYGCLSVLLLLTILFYSVVYPKVSKLVLNNMCMLIGIGIMIISRLDFDKSVKQLFIVACSLGISVFVPVIIRKAKFLSKPFCIKIYGVIGFVSLALVAVAGTTSYGAKLGFTVAGISIQPSELVKLIFVFFVATSLYHAKSFKDIVVTTVVAAAHVLILVVSTDLGAAVILFVVYLVMLYVGTKQILYLFAGGSAGAMAAVIAHKLFYHVQVRVQAWQDPFSAYDTGGYQIAQSLFAIGTGGWIGMGLFTGAPDLIPVAVEDFVFAAIAEELGLVFALCLILVYVSCYIMFLNIAMQMVDKFYKLVALGLGTTYIFQVFLTIGGVIKFIPSTGVTLPFVSYGGSSVLSTTLMFAIIQGLYILREDEEEDIERERDELIRRTRKKASKVTRRGR